MKNDHANTPVVVFWSRQILTKNGHANKPDGFSIHRSMAEYHAYIKGMQELEDVIRHPGQVLPLESMPAELSDKLFSSSNGIIYVEQSNPQYRVAMKGHSRVIEEIKAA